MMPSSIDTSSEATQRRSRCSHHSFSKKRRSGNQKLLSFNARWVGWICAQTQYRRYLVHISDICSRGASSSASSHPVAMVGRSSRRNSSASASAAKHLSSFDSIVCPGSHNTTSYFIPVSVHRVYPEYIFTVIDRNALATTKNNSFMVSTRI